MPVVIELDAHRAAAPLDHEPLRCRCGSEWFRLDGGSAGPAGTEHGALTMDCSGQVGAFMGQPVCVECGDYVQVP